MGSDDGQVRLLNAADLAQKVAFAPIKIEADAWVCADAFVGPGVRIGTGAILGARGVAMKDLADRHLGLGNPMQVKAM